MKKVKFAGNNCEVLMTKYMDNENLALVLVDEETGEMVSRVTVNTGDKLPDDVAVVKDYSENSGMLEAITEAGLVKETLKSVQVGYTTCPVVKFNLEDIEEI